MCPPDNPPPPPPPPLKNSKLDFGACAQKSYSLSPLIKLLYLGIYISNSRFPVFHSDFQFRIFWNLEVGSVLQGAAYSISSPLLLSIPEISSLRRSLMHELAAAVWLLSVVKFCFLHAAASSWCFRRASDAHMLRTARQTEEQASLITQRCAQHTVTAGATDFLDLATTPGEPHMSAITTSPSIETRT